MPATSRPRSGGASPCPPWHAMAARKPAKSLLLRERPTHVAVVGRILCPAAPTASSYNLLASLDAFFDDDAHRETLFDILAGRGVLALRVLKWCVVNYCKHKGCAVYDGTTVDASDLHAKYIAMHREYHRSAFDAFCRERGTRVFIRLVAEDGEPAWLSTTIAQLNFMRWAMCSGAVGFATANRADVALHMRETLAARACRRAAPEGGFRRSALCHGPKYRPLLIVDGDLEEDMSKPIFLPPPKQASDVAPSP
jgi:hypothetical protein